MGRCTLVAGNGRLVDSSKIVEYVYVYVFYALYGGNSHQFFYFLFISRAGGGWSKGAVHTYVTSREPASADSIRATPARH